MPISWLAVPNNKIKQIVELAFNVIPEFFGGLLDMYFCRIFRV